MRYLLFDIDGTLLVTSAGRAALETAIRDAFALQQPDCSVDFSGRTDRSIVSELLDKNGLLNSEENFTRLKDSYLRVFPAELEAEGARLLPGVRSLLWELTQLPSVKLVAMTGNFEQAGKEKLRFCGLHEYFTAVSGGDTDRLRDDLARRTVEALVPGHRSDAPTQLLNYDLASDFTVIGDTPADIQCAKAIGAKAIGVCTGWYTQDQLLSESPDRIFSDLGETAEVIAELVS